MADLDFRGSAILSFRWTVVQSCSLWGGTVPAGAPFPPSQRRPGPPRPSLPPGGGHPASSIAVRGILEDFQLAYV